MNRASCYSASKAILRAFAPGRAFCTSPIKKRQTIEVPFSKSPAYFGTDRNINEPVYIPDYYDSTEYRRKKAISVIASMIAFFAYVGYFREENDIDALWSMPPHELTLDVERIALTEKLNRAKAAGKDTELLEAELDYVKVKEDGMRQEYERQKLKYPHMRAEFAEKK